MAKPVDPTIPTCSQSQSANVGVADWLDEAMLKDLDTAVAQAVTSCRDKKQLGSVIVNATLQFLRPHLRLNDGPKRTQDAATENGLPAHQLAEAQCEKIGEIGIDAGLCWIGDPSYILHAEPPP